MTMIPPKIKKLPGLRKNPNGSVNKPSQGSAQSNVSSINDSEMVR